MPHYRLNLETRELQLHPSVWDGGTSRSLGAPGWAPADKEQEPNPQVLEPTKGSSLIASLSIVLQVSGNTGITVVCTVLILPVLDSCFMILSLITQFHFIFSFSLYGIDDVYLKSCYIPFLCGYEASLTAQYSNLNLRMRWLISCGVWQ